jgi:hypothetical protein
LTTRTGKSLDFDIINAAWLDKVSGASKQSKSNFRGKGMGVLDQAEKFMSIKKNLECCCHIWKNTLRINTFDNKIQNPNN